MGRTKRKRKQLLKTPTLTYTKSIVNLQKWMSTNNWKNTAKLKIRAFLETGRGISSTKSISYNDILVSMPIDLMITYRSLIFSFPLKEKLTMQELLSIFLISEKLKDSQSKWVEYLRSLPEELPAIPWLASRKEINLFPADLRIITEKNLANRNKFLEKLKYMENTNLKFGEDLCTWAYVMVNTRAVYVDPNLVGSNSTTNILLDEPSMALCPFLDMFNHHFSVKTDINMVQDGHQLVYQLKSLTNFHKHDQIFISYGEHDNTKLLMEYGFFIPENIHDVSKFEFQEVLNVAGFNLDKNRYKFIIDHVFNKDLYYGHDGISYNLKAVLFVGSSEEFRHIGANIFNDSYPANFLHELLPTYIRSLLDFKKDVFIRELTTLQNGELVSDSAKNVLEFAKFRIQFVDKLRRTL